MTINISDIKLLESERMTDTTDGGGRRTSRVIPDGVAGAVFPKISRVDSVYGRVFLRKVFHAVQTDTVDVLAGAHAILTDAPDDPKVHVTLFSTGSEFDTRSAARDRIESYVTSGPESRMILLGRQLAGQQQIIAYQRIEEAMPEVGEVYCLSTEVGSVVTSYQYFRIDSVSDEVRTFTETIGGGYLEFKRRVLTIGTGVPLRYEFNGPANATQNSAVTRPSLIRTTTVVDAARYYGIRPLAEACAAGDLTVKVDSIYSPLVPSTNRETPLANASIGSASNIVAAKAASVSEVVAAAWPAGSTWHTRRPMMPGSVSVSGAGVTATVDDGKGTISHGTFSATINYETGTITRNGGTAGAGSYTLNYIPAGVAPQTAHTVDVPITIGNRGTVWVFRLSPIPSPGSTYIDYRALGKWYRLRDQGDGTFAGSDAAYGSGILDFTTGNLVLTLGALPDVGSSIIVSHGARLHYQVRADATSVAGTAVRQRIQLTDLPVNPGSIVATWHAAGALYTATDDGNGNISGTGLTGKIDYITGIGDLEYTTRLPDSATGLVIEYDQLLPVVTGQVVAMSKSETYTPTIHLGTGVTPTSFSGGLPLNGGSVLIKDDGAGLVIVKGGQPLLGSNATIPSDQVVGTINYSTGDVVITAGVMCNYETYTPAMRFGAPGVTTPRDTEAAWTATNSVLAFGGGVANYGWRNSGVTTSTEAVTLDITFADSPLVIDLLATVAEDIVPGALMFAAGGKTIIDRSGSLYCDISNVSGAGTLAGSIDYASGDARLTTWTDGALLGLAVQSCLTTRGEHTEYEFFFRTAGSPLRAGSFYVQAVAAEGGAVLSATSSEGGAISGAKVSGTIDQTTGVVRLKFGQMVAAAGNESAWWYDADSVTGGMIFKPELVIASTLTYNAVMIANLPLNADQLGLDPVRLPMDGRVPIYRPVDVVVIHNTQDFELPNPAVAGATYNVGRTYLAKLWLVDQGGVKLPTSAYTYDPDTGDVTLANPLNLAGLEQPLIARHRIEDMAMVKDVQINGELTLADGITHDYAAGTSYVSSALLFGDVYARVENVFDLQAFTAWSNTAGTGAPAQYNDIDYPIEIENNGAVTERWRISFTTANNFQVIGENLGVIASGSTGVDCAPVNALTGHRYFRIRYEGWGGGWAAGNQLRFNTVSAAPPSWLARTVLPGAALAADTLSQETRGDVDME